MNACAIPPLPRRFGKFELNAAARKLTFGRERSELPPLSFEQPVALARAVPERVSREALAVARCGRVVALAAKPLTERVKLLRNVLAPYAE